MILPTILRKLEGATLGLCQHRFVPLARTFPGPRIEGAHLSYNFNRSKTQPGKEREIQEQSANETVGARPDLHSRSRSGPVNP